MKVYFVIVGMLIFLLGLYLLYRRIYFLKHSALAEGKIVSYERRTLDGTRAYHPIIRFTLENGHVFTFTSVAGSGSSNIQKDT